MKTIKIAILLSIFIMVIISSCTRPGCPPLENICDTCSSYYPEKDTFKLGDTLWFKLKIPKLFMTECGYYEFKKDSLKTQIPFGYSKIFDSLGWHHHMISDKKIFFKFGSVYSEYNIFYFVYDKTKGYYINEFGIILQDTGKIYFGTIDANKLYFEIQENVNPLFGRSSYWKLTGFISTSFIETDTGFFSIYVKP